MKNTINNYFFKCFLSKFHLLKLIYIHFDQSSLNSKNLYPLLLNSNNGFGNKDYI